MRVGLRVGRQPWLPPLGGCSVREDELNKPIGFEEGSCGEVMREDELKWFLEL